MPPYERQLLFVLLFSILLSLIYSAGPVPRVRKQAARPEKYDWGIGDHGVCSGRYNGRTLSGGDRMTELRTMYQNCTKVYGNVEITHLTSAYVNSSLTERLTFFDSIEEIKGYLLIYNVDIESISFKRLKVIWGDFLLDGESALSFSGNHKLKEVYFPSLRAIHRGNVNIENNTFLCYLKDRVRWNELLDNQADTRLMVASNAFRDCPSIASAMNYFPCNESCPKSVNKEEGPFCWSKMSRHCQPLYRSVCPTYCSSRQCFLPSDAVPPISKNSYECCHQNCEGGCTGPSDTECISCRDYRNENRCVPQCPRLMIPSGGKLVANPDGRYISDRTCVEQCAPELLIDDEHCVRYCSEGKTYNMQSKTNPRLCEKCVGQCPKVCNVDGTLTGSRLRSLKGCDVIEGYIEILDSRMTDEQDGYTVEDLAVLRSVRMVTEYVHIAAPIVSPVKLDFFENLEIIGGRSLYNHRYAMILAKNDNLRYLGLRKLKKIIAGDVIMQDNFALCFINSMNWSDIVSDNATVTNTRSQDDGKCARRKMSCDENCAKSAGCWGPGADLCVACAALSLNGKCMAKCPSEGYYKNATSKECLACAGECKTCSGPNPAECLSCRGVSIRHETGQRCSEECPVTHFRQGTTCLMCHKSCYDLGCTGESDHLGEGGCNKCKYAERNATGENAQVVRCLYANATAKEVCQTNGLTHYFAMPTQTEGVEDLHCDPCDEQCDSCTSAGRSILDNGCQCRNYIVEEWNSCVDSCLLKIHFVKKEKNITEAGVCAQCSPLCDRNVGCTGPTEHDCLKCANYTLTLESGTKQCVDDCYEFGQFPGFDKNCDVVDQVTARQRRAVVLYGSIALGFVALMILIAIIYCRCIKIKRKLKEAEIINLPEVPEVVKLDSSIRANTSKMIVMSGSELQSKAKPLGAGAFGIVYAGYWYPPRGKGKIKVPVAIKVVKNRGSVTGKEEQEMLEEAAKMAMMRHEHLLRLVGVCMRENEFQLVTLLRPLGNLLEFLKKHKNGLRGKNLLLYCYQISSAMKYLYEHRLVHRDLAARNVLVKAENHVEVTDFGLSKMLEIGKDTVTVGEGKVAIKWLALECLKEQVYNHATDVWAFGVTCWEILTFGMSPYQGMDMCAIRNYLRDGNRLSQPDNCSTELYQLLLQCWMANPESRPTFVILYDRLKSFCHVPQLYVTDDDRADSIEMTSQKDLLMEILEENDPNFTDPFTYFDQTNDTVDSPTTSESFHMPRVRRMQSTSSQRYQTDPMLHKTDQNRPAALGMDDGNYLVPNARVNHDTAATLYTPVVVNEHGQTELISSHDYYNNAKEASGDGYYNDVKQPLHDIHEETQIEMESCV